MHVAQRLKDRGTYNSALREQRSRVAMSDQRGLLWRQLRKPGAIAGHDFTIARPALRDPGIRTEQEAVGIFFEEATPFRRQLASALGDAAAVGQFTPELRIFRQHGGDAVA